MKSDMIPVIKHFTYLVEYEVLTNIYMAIGNFILSPKEYVRKRSVDLGLLEIISEASQETTYLRFKRICNSILQKTDPQLFDYM